MVTIKPFTALSLCRYLISGRPVIHCVENSTNHRESQRLQGLCFLKEPLPQTKREVEESWDLHPCMPTSCTLLQREHRWCIPRIWGHFRVLKVTKFLLEAAEMSSLHRRVTWERHKPFMTRSCRVRSLERSQVAFINKLQCGNTAKTRSKRTLQGTVSSTLKVSISCLLTNLILLISTSLSLAQW